MNMRNFRKVMMMLILLMTETVATVVSNNDQGSAEGAPPCKPEDSLLKCMCDSGDAKPFEGAVLCIRDMDGKRTNHSKAILKPLQCIWYNNITQTLLAGMCPFGRYPSTVRFNKSVKVEDVNVMSCKLGHTGVMCGKCSPLHSLMLNSYSFECVKDTQCSSGYWVLFFIQQLLPTLVFFVIFTFFNIKAVQGYLNSFVLTAQLLTIQMNLVSIRLGWAYALDFHTPHVSKKLTDVIASLYSIWNLNIFYGVLPSYCARNNLRILPAIALEYISGVFPIVIVLVTYIVIKLHARNFRVLVILWKPFNRCCIRFRRCMNPKTSVVDALAMFIVLSYTKFVVISCMLLAPNWLITLEGTNRTAVYLYDGKVEYLKGDHILYATIAVAVCVLFIVPLPVLLLVYPLACFQKCLNRLNFRNHFTTAFMDALQGCYKDGSDGRQDCRYFSAVYFLLRIVINGVYSLLYVYNVYIFFFINVCLLLALAVIVLYRPYKNDMHNKFDAAIFIHLIFIVSLAALNKYFWDMKGGSLTVQVLLYISLCLPAIAMGIYVTLSCIKKIMKFKRGQNTYWSLDNKRFYGESLEKMIAENQNTS